MIDGARVLALIPARGGSKGVPGKNIRPVGGRPLLAWTVAAARNSAYVDRVVLSSDDDAIMQAARDAGCEVPFRRDAALATDTVASIDVVLDAVDRVPGFDIVVLLQPTSPLRTASDIDGALERMQAVAAPSCVSVREAQDHPYWTYRIEAGGALGAFVPQATAVTRRQDLPAAWCLNGAVYAARVDWLRAHRGFVGSGTVGFEMPIERSLDIDTLHDLERLEAIMGQ